LNKTIRHQFGGHGPSVPIATDLHIQQFTIDRYQPQLFQQIVELWPTETKQVTEFPVILEMAHSSKWTS